MEKTISLGQVPIGEDFSVWDREFTVLDRLDNGIFALQRTIEAKMDFCKMEQPFPRNRFADSAVRDFLNGDYLARLQARGARKDDLRDFTVDLKCTLGCHEYGICSVTAGLLTLEQYGTYYDIIPLADDMWWLATPWKTPSHTPFQTETAAVWLVASNGNYASNVCYWPHGVRPTLTIDPALIVTVEK